MTDAILEEMHRIKDGLAKEHGNDVRAALAATRLRQQRSRRRILRVKRTKIKAG